MGHLAKSHQKISRRQRAQRGSAQKPPNESKYGEAENEASAIDTSSQTQRATVTIEQALSSGDVGPPILGPGPAAARLDQNLPHVTRPMHPLVKESAARDRQRDSVGSQFTITTVADSVISGVTDLSINELDIDRLLRPASEYSIPAVALATSVVADNTVNPPETPARPKPIPPTKVRKSITLSDVLSGRTKFPYGFWDFYAYMRVVVRAVGYLDFWYACGAHILRKE
jgi:hypothetical protein